MAAAQQKRRGQCRTEPGRHFGTVSPKEELRHQEAVEGSLASRPPHPSPSPHPPFKLKSPKKTGRQKLKTLKKQNFRKAQMISENPKTSKPETIANAESKSPEVKENTGAHTRQAPTTRDPVLGCTRDPFSRGILLRDVFSQSVKFRSYCYAGWGPSCSETNLLEQP